MGLIADWINQQLGWASWIPGALIVVQGLLSLLLLIFTFAAILFLPGWKLKVASLIIGFVAIIVVWFV